MTALTVMTTTIKMMMGNKHEWHTLRRLKFNLKKAKLASIFQKLIQAMKLDWSHQKLVYIYKSYNRNYHPADVQRSHQNNNRENANIFQCMKQLYIV